METEDKKPIAESTLYHLWDLDAYFVVLKIRDISEGAFEPRLSHIKTRGNELVEKIISASADGLKGDALRFEVPGPNRNMPP